MLSFQLNIIHTINGISIRLLGLASKKGFLVYGPIFFNIFPYPGTEHVPITC